MTVVDKVAQTAPLFNKTPEKAEYSPLVPAIYSSSLTWVANLYCYYFTFVAKKNIKKNSTQYDDTRVFFRRSLAVS